MTPQPRTPEPGRMTPPRRWTLERDDFGHFGVLDQPSGIEERWEVDDRIPVIEVAGLVDFIDGRILAARQLRRGFSTEDERRGHSRELALEEVRAALTGVPLDPDVRCEHDWPEWASTPDDGEFRAAAAAARCAITGRRPSRKREPREPEPFTLNEEKALDALRANRDEGGEGLHAWEIHEISGLVYVESLRYRRDQRRPVQARPPRALRADGVST